MKVKKSEIQLLIAVIGVLIAVCTYFLVYSSFNEKSDALEAQNVTLSSQVATLEALDQRKATAAAATTAASPVSTDGTAYADTHMYEVPLSISISCTYDDFKGLVRYIYNQQERESIQGVSISYNETDGMLTGNMTMNTYYLLGTDKVYSSPYIPDMQMGVDTIFGNVE